MCLDTSLHIAEFTEYTLSSRDLDVIPGKLIGCFHGIKQSLTVLPFVWHSLPVILISVPVVQASDDSNAGHGSTERSSRPGQGPAFF